MADVERRGEKGDHAWAELTWIKFVKFLFIAWLAGVFSGFAFFAVGIYTTIYQTFLVSVWLFMLANPWLDLFGFGLLIIMIYILVKINRPRKKQVQVPLVKK